MKGVFRMQRFTVETSKGEFPLAEVGRNKGYEVNAINDCAKGYFLLNEDGSREWFTSRSDELIIREAQIICQANKRSR